MKGPSLGTSAGLVFADGAWHEGNPALIGPRTHGLWLGSTVFDGARYFDGAAPDLTRHCQRAVESAKMLGLAPMLTGEEIAELAWTAFARFPARSQLYVMPVFWADDGFIVPDPASTRFALCVYEAQMPQPTGFSACLSNYRRPAKDMAPTQAKAACLYPNVARAVREANEKGFDTAVMIDPAGNVAEFSYTNLFMVKDGQVHTPAPNGTFLNGLTRQRVIQLLRDDGVEVIERSIEYSELLTADEVFATGNFFKVGPCTRLDDRTFAIGETYKRARALYWEFARASGC